MTTTSSAPFQIEARISPEWTKRMMMIALFAFALGGWFFYDAYIGYPKQNVRAAEFAQFVQEGRQDKWEDYAASKGWKISKEGPGPAKTPAEISQQKKLGVVLLVLGCVAVAYFLFYKGKTLRADAETIYGPTGKTLPFATIRDLDMRKWKSKGIAVAIFEKDGQSGRMAIDDYKFVGAVEILEEIRRRLGRVEPLE